MSDKTINPRSPAPWDTRIEGEIPALVDLSLTPEEQAKLEEIAALANGAGREALTDDDKWLHSQFRDEKFHGNNLIVHGLARNPEQVQFHGLATARALRNLGRFDEAWQIAESLPYKTAERDGLLATISVWAAAIAVKDCDCERETHTYTDTTRTQRLPDGTTGHPKVSITPNRRHRAERVYVANSVRWLYRCSICGGLSLPGELPERHQAIHAARAEVTAASRANGEPFRAVTDAELLK